MHGKLNVASQMFLEKTKGKNIGRADTIINNPEPNAARKRER